MYIFIIQISTSEPILRHKSLQYRSILKLAEDIKCTFALHNDNC